MTRFAFQAFLVVSLALSAFLGRVRAADDAGGTEEVYLAPEAFVAAAFSDGDPGEARFLWLTDSVKPGVREILGRDYRALRVRYWARGGRTAWVLDEIGKVQPITIGVVVEDGAIRGLSVLIYRESHGWEVRQPFFTDQFLGASLDARDRLDTRIDGISGATLSVNAIRTVARLALFLDRSTRAEATP